MTEITWLVLALLCIVFGFVICKLLGARPEAQTPSYRHKQCPYLYPVENGWLCCHKPPDHLGNHTTLFEKDDPKYPPTYQVKWRKP